VNFLNFSDCNFLPLLCHFSGELSSFFFKASLLTDWIPFALVPSFSCFVMSEPDSNSPFDSSIVNKVIDDIITPLVTSDSPKPVEQKKEEEPVKTSGSSGSEPSSSSASSTSVASQETEKISTQLENMTIFGNKSLEELHRIQANRSHLSAGILFTDPNLRM
jgi:hypothetical protein